MDFDLATMPAPCSWGEVQPVPDAAEDIRIFLETFCGVPPPEPPPRDPEAARATLQALGWVFPEVDPDGAVLRPERRVRCDVGDAARGPVERAVVAAVRAARREGEG